MSLKYKMFCRSNAAVVSRRPLSAAGAHWRPPNVKAKFHNQKRAPDLAIQAPQSNFQVAEETFKLLLKSGPGLDQRLDKGSPQHCPASLAQLMQCAAQFNKKYLLYYPITSGHAPQLRKCWDILPSGFKEDSAQHMHVLLRVLVVEMAVADASAIAFQTTSLVSQVLSALPGRKLHGDGAALDAIAAAAGNQISSIAVPTEASQSGNDGGVYSGMSSYAASHLFLQRTLYRINRLNHFWFDDLRNYENERSVVIAALRNALESAWAKWELQQNAFLACSAHQLTADQVRSGLRERYRRDVDPPQSDVGKYIANDMGIDGYRQLLAIGSLDGLTEASRQSRVCAGAANKVSNAVFRVLMEEYGSGQLSRKHSTFYASMLRELALDDKTEAYLDLLPWQCLASTNHNFMLTETRRGYLRYIGGLTYFEIVGPSVYRNYLAAAQRLGLSEGASSYWTLHIKEDERHGRWMLQDVAEPLVDMYPNEAWEVIFGYDQEVALSSRAAQAVLQSIRKADAHGFPG